MFTYKYFARHRIGLRQYLALAIKGTMQNISSPWVRPIDADIGSCFVMGCGHSGTTLMAAKLGLSDECFLVGRETGNFLPGRGLYTSKAVAEEWVYFATYFGKRFIIEKTPKHVHIPGRIKKVFPGAKFVVMVRNPLDTCASLNKRFWKRDFSLPIERWNMDNGAALEVIKRYPEDTIVVYYENFTQAPEKELHRVFGFLGVAWDEKVTMEGKSAYNIVLKKGNMTRRAEQTAREIKPNNGKWREFFNSDQEETVFKKTRDVALRLGYDTETMMGYLENE